MHRRRRAGSSPAAMRAPQTTAQAARPPRRAQMERQQPSQSPLDGWDRSTRRLDCLDDRQHDFLDLAAVYLCRWRQDNPMTKERGCELLHVVGDDEVAAIECGA